MTTCENCEREIRQYVHSRAGSLTVSAWTTVMENDEDDPRDGTFCDEHGDWPWTHRPEMRQDVPQDAIEYMEGER